MPTLWLRAEGGLDSQLELPCPGLGFMIIVAIITLFGYLSTHYVFRTIDGWFGRGMNKIPIVKLIYSTVRDLLNAFVGEKKKFAKPVLVRINKDNDLYQLGFVTQSDLSALGLKDMVVVYFPHSVLWKKSEAPESNFPGLRV